MIAIGGVKMKISAFTVSIVVLIFIAGMLTGALVVRYFGIN